MDKVSASGAEDCGFESHQGRNYRGNFYPKHVCVITTSNQFRDMIAFISSIISDKVVLLMLCEPNEILSLWNMRLKRVVLMWKMLISTNSPYFVGKYELKPHLSLECKHFFHISKYTVMYIFLIPRNNGITFKIGDTIWWQFQDEMSKNWQIGT